MECPTEDPFPSFINHVPSLPEPQSPNLGVILFCGLQFLLTHKGLQLLSSVHPCTSLFCFRYHLPIVLCFLDLTRVVQSYQSFFSTQPQMHFPKINLV